MKKILLFILLFSIQCSSVESSRRISASGDPEDIFFEKEENSGEVLDNSETVAKPDEKAIDTAEKPAETLARSVDDNVIEPNKSDRNFDEVGFSSWYGPRFQGKQTASGEIFDKNQLTAAHPSLPMGTVIRVYNFDNNKEAVVRVNDRGPYSGNRILDVSEKTAELLNFKHSGVAKVGIQVVKNGQVPADKIEKNETVDDEELELTAAIEEEDKALPVEKPKAKKQEFGEYYVQLGVFMNKDGAQKTIDKMKKNGHSVKLVEKDGMYILQMGSFKDRKSAEILRDELKNQGIDCFIPKK